MKQRKNNIEKSWRSHENSNYDQNFGYPLLLSTQIILVNIIYETNLLGVQKIKNCMHIVVLAADFSIPIQKFMVKKFMIEKSGVEKSGVEKFMVEKSRVENSGVGKFMVEKSGVERSGVEALGWKVRGWNVLQPSILLCLKPKPFKFFLAFRHTVFAGAMEILTLYSSFNHKRAYQSKKNAVIFEALNNMETINFQDLSPLEVDKADLGPQEDHQAASLEV